MIGATKLDEKMLDEIRKQEQILNQIEENENGDEKESETKYEPGVVVGDSGQTTLFGGGN